MFCPKGGRELSAGLLVCSECDSKMDNGNMISQNPLRKTSKYIHLTAVILGIIVLLIVFCPVGYRYYKIAQLKTKLEEVMEKDAAYMETVLKLETDSPNITYKEAFDLCDSSVEDRNKLIIELRALYPDIEYELKDDIINFLNAENELTRAKKSVYQRSLDLGVILDVSDEALAEIKSGITIFEVPYYREKLKKLQSELQTLKEENITAMSEYIETYQKLLKQEEDLAKKMQKENIRFRRVFKQYEEQNIKNFT